MFDHVSSFRMQLKSLCVDSLIQHHLMYRHYIVSIIIEFFNSVQMSIHLLLVHILLPSIISDYTLCTFIPRECLMEFSIP